MRWLDPLSQTRPVPGFPPGFQFLVPAGIYFRFPLTKRIQSRFSSGCPFSSSLTNFSISRICSKFTYPTCKAKMHLLSQKKLTPTTHFPCSSAFLPLICLFVLPQYPRGQRTRPCESSFHNLIPPSRGS